VPRGLPRGLSHAGGRQAWATAQKGAADSVAQSPGGKSKSDDTGPARQLNRLAKDEWSTGGGVEFRRNRLSFD